MANYLPMLLVRSLMDEMVFCGDEGGDIPWDILVARGYLTATLPATMVCCACLCFVEVVWLTNPLRQRLPYACCEHCGVISISPKSLLRWELRLDALLRETQRALEIRGGLEEMLPGMLWRLGRKRNTEYVYLRRWNPQEKQTVRDALARRPRCVVMTGTQETSRRLRRETDLTQVVAMEGLAQINEAGIFMMDMHLLNDLPGFDGVKIAVKKASPQPKRGERAAKIEKLTRALESHVRSAIAHAKSTGGFGNIEFFPRPTQMQLAKMTGLTKMDVSRCLSDPDAKLLRMLWEKADDLRSALR